MEQNKMFSCAELVADQMTLLADGRFINVDSYSARCSVIFPLDVFFPLLYTGLLDKNGIESCEGDIIKTPQDIFKLEYSEKDYCIVFYVNSAEQFMSLPYLVGLKDFEVIGNIYENPELLNK